jgi:hypothetical protein
MRCILFWLKSQGLEIARHNWEFGFFSAVFVLKNYQALDQFRCVNYFSILADFFLQKEEKIQVATKVFYA